MMPTTSLADILPGLRWISDTYGGPLFLAVLAGVILLLAEHRRKY